MELRLAENLRFFRKKKGYTLEAVSELIGVSRQSVSKWELGETYPDISNCAKLAELYDVTLDELIMKPMQIIDESKFMPHDDHLIGMVKISETNEIKLPESLLTLFEMSSGDQLLLMADKKRGIALVKFSDLG